MKSKFDVIVVGGGHAGCEAAVAASRRGARVAIFTMDDKAMGKMSCNPAWGGIGKGHLIFEVTALGGICGRAADETGMHFRRLNRSKGPAVRGTRIQCDRAQYSLAVSKALIAIENIKIFPVEVASIKIVNDQVSGVVTDGGDEIEVPAVIVATGTFLGAKLFRGEASWTGGRIFEGASVKLAKHLSTLGVQLRRLKTGTPPRLAGDGIDFSQWIPQTGDDPAPGFTAYYKNRHQLLCFKSKTNEAVHDELRKGFERSPLFTGRISGVGPPYCPSIEDKVRRYPERDEHPIFLEPEGWDGKLWYLAGFSSSLPEDVQEKALRNIPGLRDVEVMQHAYAVEYWAIKSQEMDKTLAHPQICGLFWAGQVCGTSGYEEAAGLGVVAGINSAAFVFDKDSWVPKPDDSYLGVMIRDLVESEQGDPYRILTSRAENRLQLREYNARYRLADIAFRLGLISKKELEVRKKEQEEISEGTADSEKPNLAEEMDAVKRYKGYMSRYKAMDERMKELWEHPLITMDWDSLVGLSKDGCFRVKKGNPTTLAAAARLGVRYADLLLIMTASQNRCRKQKQSNDENKTGI